MRILGSVGTLAGVRLKAWRVEHQRSQQDIARALNAAGHDEVKQWHISLIENGRLEPRARLAAALEALTGGSVRASDDWLSEDFKSGREARRAS
jgi:transcriptional regulator with XRE-family HTH domain